MITQFKIFENFDEAKPNFEIGDIVVCTNDRKLGTRKGYKYLVTNIFYDDENGARGGSWYCFLKGGDDFMGNPIWYFCRDFISEIEYNAKKFNL